MNKLTIRKSGKYYQIGYYDKSKWIQVHQLGTPEKLLKRLGVSLPETHQLLEPKKISIVADTHQNLTLQKNTTFY